MKYVQCDKQGCGIKMNLADPRPGWETFRVAIPTPREVDLCPSCRDKALQQFWITPPEMVQK